MSQQTILLQSGQLVAVDQGTWDATEADAQLMALGSEQGGVHVLADVSAPGTPGTRNGSLSVQGAKGGIAQNVVDVPWQYAKVKNNGDNEVVGAVVIGYILSLETQNTPYNIQVYHGVNSGTGDDIGFFPAGFSGKFDYNLAVPNGLCINLSAAATRGVLVAWRPAT